MLSFVQVGRSAIVSFCALMFGAVGSVAQVKVEDPASANIDAFVADNASELASKVIKAWENKNSDLTNAQIGQVMMHVDTTYVTRYMATSYDGQSLAISISKTPISYLEVSYNGIILGSVRFDEGGRSLVVAHETKNILTSSEGDANPADVAFRKMVDERKPFTILGIDRVDDLFYFQAEELYSVDHESLSTSKVDVSALAPKVYKEANRRRAGGVFFSALGGSAVCAFLAIIILL